MMPPKKKSTNGFMIFTMEWKSKYGKQLSISEATDRAGGIWAKMSSHERGPYNEQAKKNKNSISNEKMTCMGTPMSIIEKEKREVEQQERTMKRNIEVAVRKGLRNCDLQDKNFYFIMVNYFTKTLNHGIYVPAEISLCQYTLRGGVCNRYHSFINPGVNIYGHTFEAQHHSDNTHKLPLPPNALGEKDLGKIYNDILHFIRPEDDSEYPPVYTKRESMPIVESVLSFLSSDIGANNVSLNVYSLQYLFFNLKEATCEIGELEKPNSIFITDAYLDRDFFEYQTGIACDFHETADKSNYCTLSCVTRWAYMFSDYMCLDMAITLIAGRHVPVSTNIESAMTLSTTLNDAASFLSMGTEASYASNPLSENKKIYDDQKSYTSCQTLVGSEEFPKLRTSSKKESVMPQKSLKQIKSAMDSDDEGSEINPWNIRSQKKLKQPEFSDFKVDCKSHPDTLGDLSESEDYVSVTSYGRGRGNNFRSFPGSYGRGHQL